MLKAVIDELARRFATTSAGGTGRHRLRERTDDLIIDLLAALRTASLGEIADTTRALERRRKTRTSARSVAHAEAPSPTGRARKAEPSSDSGPSSAVEERPPAAPRNPFDITVPSELLEGPVAASAPPRAARKQTSDLLGISVPAPPKVEEPPHRSVSLREGEQLLRTSGAGAIIRRVRGS